MKKVISILLTVFTLSTFAFSIESGLYKGSSNTVSDDSASYMDVLGWQNLYFENLYAFTSIDSTKSVNIAAANNFLDGVLAYSYSGNLWGEDVVDEYALFYGFDKFGVLYNLETNSVDNGQIQQIGVNNYSYLSPSLKIGMNINEAFAFTAGFKLAHEGGKITNDAMKYTIYQNIPEVQLAGYYTFMNTSKVSASANISYDGRFGSTKASTTVGDTTTTTKSTENQNTLALEVSAEVRLADRFIYGLDATLPSITFISGKNFDGDAIPNQSQVSFEVRNGFVATLIPDTLLVSMGMTTTLPSITYIEKQDNVLGSLYNSYDFALGLYLSPAVRIDGSCSISPVDGISLEEIWNSEMNLTVSVNF